MPRVYRVIVSGGQETGKTAIVGCLSDPQYQLDAAYHETLGASFASIKTDPNSGDSFAVWDFAGSPMYAPLVTHYTPGTNLVLYCVDVSRPIDQNKINQDLAQFAGVPVIIVGTKADLLAADADPVSILEQIRTPSNVNICKLILTSAQNRLGFSRQTYPLIKLEDGTLRIENHATTLKECMVEAFSPYNTAKNRLFNTLLSNLTVEQARGIRRQLNLLEASPRDENGAIPLRNTQEFVTNCSVILEGEHPNVMNAVYAVAVAVVVASLVVALATVFGLGLSTLALASVSAGSGVAMGGWTSYGLFGKSASNAFELQTFCNDIQPPAQVVP